MTDHTKIKVATAIMIVSLLLVALWIVMRFVFNHEISNSMLISQALLILSMALTIRSVRKKLNDDK